TVSRWTLPRRGLGSIGGGALRSWLCMPAGCRLVQATSQRAACVNDPRGLGGRLALRDQRRRLVAPPVVVLGVDPREMRTLRIQPGVAKRGEHRLEPCGTRARVLFVRPPEPEGNQAASVLAEALPGERIFGEADSWGELLREGRRLHAKK